MFPGRKVFIMLLPLLFFYSPGFTDSVTYYNSEHAEISAQEFNKEAESYQKKYRQAKKSWGRADSDLIREVIKLSGMDQPIKTLPQNIDMLSKQGTLSSGQPELDKKAIQLLKESFNPQQANNKLVRYCQKNMSENMLKEVVPWLRSPEARKITRAENAMHSPGAQIELAAFLSDLQNEPPPQERVVIMEEFVESANMVNNAVDLAMEVFKGITVSMNLAFPEEKRLDKSRILSLVERIKPTIANQLKQQIRLSVYYIYRDISNEELDAYIAFLNSESGSQFNQIATDAVTQVLVDYFKEVGAKIASSLQV